MPTLAASLQTDMPTSPEPRHRMMRLARTLIEQNRSQREFEVAWMDEEESLPLKDALADLGCEVRLIPPDRLRITVR